MHTFIKDILSKKEFVINKPSGITKDGEIEQLLRNSNRLELRSYQEFAKKYMSPNNKVTRLFIKYGTGMGKTALSLSIAIEYIDMILKARDLNPKDPVPNIVIVGFTKQIFRRELLKFPEFGYISDEEIDKIGQLKHNAEFGTAEDEVIFSDYMIYLRRRITNKRVRGIFQFYGYREFVNRIFDISNNPIDLTTLSESEIQEKIKDGSILINTKLIDNFKNALIICDEIHNTYNSCDKNNWGIAIQTLLNYHKDNIRAIFLSATPINHNPSEVVDLLNLLDIDKKHDKTDFFKINACGDYDLKVDPDEIGKLFAGKLLFVENADPRYFPSSTLDGEKINGIDILKFRRCVMSKDNYAAYKSINTETLTQDAQYLLDFALPNPDGGISLFKTNDIKNAYMSATPHWLKNNNIIVRKDKSNVIISGAFLKLPELGNISTKYKYMMEDIRKAIKNKTGKILIYHKYVHMSGIIFIREILIQNGIIDEYSEPSNDTLDVITGLTLEQHTKTKCKTEFAPARFCIIHSDIEPNVRDNSIERYNARKNAEGTDVLILLGADVIKESYDIKCVRNLFIMSKPDNISTMIQIFGRGKRQDSHSYLPPDKRTILYRIYVASLPTGELSYEEKKYKERVDNYKIVREIEKSMHEYAIDGIMNHDIIKNTFVPPNELGTQKYIPKFNVSNKINTDTYDAYYFEENINKVSYIIKRLFIEVSASLEINDIIYLVKHPPFEIQFDGSLIDDDYVRIALNRLCMYEESNYTSIPPEATKGIEFLFNADNKLIRYRDVDYIIIPMGTYYSMVPYSPNLSIKSHSKYDNRIIDKLPDMEINIGDYLSDEINETNYAMRRKKFQMVYEDCPFEILADAVCEYNIMFQTMFIEEIVKNIYIAIVERKKLTKELMFDIRMLCYYDLLNLIIFYDSSEEYIKKSYRFKCAKCTATNPKIRRMEMIMEHTACKWCPEINKVSFFDKEKMIRSLIQNKSNLDGSLIPVGFHIDKVPRIYHPDNGWYDAVEYVDKCANYQENDIIVGVIEKTASGLHYRFKLRTPIHKQIKNGDTRKIEKGSLCKSKSKEELLGLLTALGVKHDGTGSSNMLCNELQARLMYLEIAERKKKSNIKYLYHFWECSPI